jgi:ABC-type branched-subunit amino acid transport system permease subunit
MRRGGFVSPGVKRFAACMAFAFVLALMVGEQEGTQSDYTYAFRQAVFSPRIAVFALIGVLLFLAITFWPRITPYLLRPGVRPLFAGAGTVVVAQTLLRWSDDIALTGGKFNELASAAADTSGLSPAARVFYGNYVGWILLLVVVALAGFAIIAGVRRLAWAATGLALVAGIWAFSSHAASRSFLGSPDHSLGAGTALLGYLTIASAAAAVALAKSDVADTNGFLSRTLGWRPGLPLVVLGLVVALVGFVTASWFSPTHLNSTFSDTRALFSGTGLAPLAWQYLTWLGWVLFAVTVAVSAAATYLQHRLLGWATVVLGVLSVVLTVVTLHAVSALAAQQAFDQATGPWENLGTGGWMVCGAFTLMAGAGYVVATLRPRDRPVSSDTVGWLSAAPGASKMLLFVVIAGALFYPPTANLFWQKVLVSEIGIYVLLAIGLNVVVGWAGLLDLGFIAFYAIGSYTTAFLVGALPVQPPSWLHLSPLMAIPFAIVICLIAGVTLGAPTLRLRGDYLAIVTLGFGEIIRIVAINNPGNFTNGPRGATNIPQPVVHVGPIHITWGQSSLQYWYLLLVIVVIVVLLFNRLEHSRLGRAWAAIREDEIAAKATGIDTARVKLMAFAIGASTSGVAGVFFASQIGYINPDNFLLNNSILVVCYVVFGGMGSLPGAIAGAAVLTWLPEFLKDQVPAEDRQMWIGAIILLMMIFRPAGLIPAKRRAAELHGLDAASSAETTAVPSGVSMGGQG